MSQAVIHGGFEPEPEGVAGFGGLSFREMDRGLALRTHLFHLLFSAEVAQVTFPEIPRELGRVMLDYSYRVGPQEYQQN